ncbi:hypothetical protein ACO0OE_000795 [Hanseniaspora uvarum]
MFSRFLPSYSKFTNIINKRIILTRKQTTGSIKGNALHAENVLLYKFKPTTKDIMLPFVLSGSLFLYAITLFATSVPLLNNNLTVEPETEEEAQLSKEYLEKLESDYQNKRINYPAYILKKYSTENRESYIKNVNNVVYTLLGGLVLSASYLVYLIPKRMIVKVYKAKNQLFMETYNNQKPIALLDNTFKIQTAHKKPLKHHDACVLYSYGSEETKKLRDSKMFDFKHIYIFKLDGAEYPNSWMTFQYYINKK